MVASGQAKLDEALMKADQKGELEALNLKRRDLAASIDTDQKRLRAAQLGKDQIELQLTALREDLKQAEKDRGSDQRSLQAIDKEIAEVTAAGRDALRAHGQQMPLLVKDINEEKRWNQKPIGPIGNMIRVTDPSWAPVIESVLDRNLDAFLVTNEHDRSLLAHHMRRRNCAMAFPIIKGTPEAFDYSSGEPPAEIATILKVLRCDDDFVLRQLMISNFIESSVLVETRQDAEHLIRSNVANVFTCYAKQGNFKVATNKTKGGLSTAPLRGLKGASRLLGDQSSRMEELRSARADAERSKGVSEDGVAKAKAAIQAKQAEERDAATELNKLREKVTAQQSESERIMDEINALSTDNSTILVFQDSIKENKERLAATEARFNEVIAHMNVIDAELENLRQGLAQAAARSEERTGKQKQLQDLIEQEAHKRDKVTGTFKHYAQQLEKYKAQLAEARTALENDELDLSDLTQQARDETGRDDMEVPRGKTPVNLEKEMTALEKTMTNHQREHGGMTLEMAKNQLDEASRALEEMKAKTATLRKFAERLLSSIDERMKRWFEWRSLIALRTKALFGVHLEHRNFKGSLQFYHGNDNERDGRLVIKVQTDAAHADEGTKSRRDKDPKSLSGGEKSFSTICLLLSLWDAMSCPIRCLDEFDVFMDAGNRSISTKMIMDVGQASKTQYILISPQSLTNAKIGPHTRIIHMKDPGRGQTTLD